MNHLEIVQKIIGPVRPVGDATIDEKRFENLKELTELIDSLLKEIDEIATVCKDSHEHSVQRAGQHCYEFMTQIGIEE